MNFLNPYTLLVWPSSGQSVLSVCVRNSDLETGMPNFTYDLGTSLLSVNYFRYVLTETKRGLLFSLKNSNTTYVYRSEKGWMISAVSSDYWNVNANNEVSKHILYSWAKRVCLMMGVYNQPFISYSILSDDFVKKDKPFWLVRTQEFATDQPWLPVTGGFFHHDPPPPTQNPTPSSISIPHLPQSPCHLNTLRARICGPTAFL